VGEPGALLSARLATPKPTHPSASPLPS